MLDFKTDIADLPALTQTFLNALAAGLFEGDILTGYADRLVHATDNSIYQIMPQAIIAPKNGTDLTKVMKLSAERRFNAIQIMPCGGGTGTNGQSLNDCIILDTSKYMTRIFDIDAQAKTVKIEPGVVPDVLNTALKKHRLTFPVHISPSKSATLGGMVSTDACGKGSRIYGKTGDYVLDITCILPDGREISTANHDDEKLRDIISDHYAQALTNTPDLPRGLSAYDIKRAYDPRTDTINMNRLITGSEGSLGVIKDITLRLIESNKKRAMIAVFYDDFIAALRDVGHILSFNPSSIETIDDTILSLAKDDILWHLFRDIIPDNTIADAIRGAHFIEFENDDENQLNAQLLDFEKTLSRTNNILHHTTIRDEHAIQNAHNIRSKCVGLLGNMKGDKRPIPFIEDTAVPPENLADYIHDLKSLLNAHNLPHGVFGHSDAGCLHVRPALDMRDKFDQSMIRTLSDEVATLVRDHGGVIWGEHGKGMRGEYTQTLIGTPYANAMQAIKTYIDPHNKLNPSKICAPDGFDIHKIDGVPMRGDFDRQISPETQSQFPKATQCNGNGLCFSAMPDDTMCPSFKVTGDRKHSPKGRAGLLREWMRLKDTNKRAAHTFAHDVHDALHGCLSCKACTSTCPIHVNIPDMKSDFLSEYHKRVRRPIRDYIIGGAERYAATAHALPAMPQQIFGLSDLPKAPRQNIKKTLHKHGFYLANKQTLKNATNPILILQDAYTSHFETETFLSILSFFKKLGYTPLIIPFFESGKSWYVRGFTQKFKTIALRNIAKLENLSRHRIPIIGIDPSITLTYRDEYHKIIGKKPHYHIHLLQEWLADNITTIVDLPKLKTIPQTRYNLFLHCTEKTMRPESADEWSAIFNPFGITLNPVQTGCCGMAGVYGHEQEHVKNSKSLFALSWEDHIDETALATGYSCRSQIARLKDYHVKHPLSLLNDLL